MRTLVFAVLGAAAAGLAAAQGTPDQAHPDAVKLDQQIQAVKDQVVVLNRDLTRVEKDINCPDALCVNVHVGVDVSGFLLQEMVVAVDDGAPTRYAYNALEQRALLKRGLHRIIRRPLQPGPHRLHAEYTGRMADAKPDAPSVTGSLDHVFDKTLVETNLILPIDRDSRFSKPGLSEVANMQSLGRRAGAVPGLERADDVGTFSPGTQDDPRVRYALYLRHDNRFFSAISELLQVAREAGGVNALPASTLLLLGDSYLQFGMRNRADEAYRLIQPAKNDALTYPRAQLRVADFEYERGYTAEATARLLALKETLPNDDDLEIEWQDQISRVLMAQGRHGEAVDILTELANADKLNAYTRYNLGVALVADGRGGQGRNVLDRVGRMPVLDKTQLALRDKANLALGYHFLRAQLGGTSKPIFGRIRVDGPYSNRALLGLGWSELTPISEDDEKSGLGDSVELVPYNTFATLGVLLRPGYFDPERWAKLGIRAFKLSEDLTAEEAEALNRALVPWIELTSRDPMDAAVQEGMLAVPYALDRLGAHEQALERYNQAIATFELARKRIDEAMVAIKAGRMVETIVKRDIDAESGWAWQLRDLPDAPETYWLAQLIAEHRYHEPLKNYRDVRFMARHLTGWNDRLGILLQRAPAQALPNVQADILVDSVRQGAPPVEQGPTEPVELRAEEGLGAAGGDPNAPPPVDPAPQPVPLAPGAIPRVDGVAEHIAALKPRLEAQRPVLAALNRDQDIVLEDIAIEELTGQRKQLDRYLLEARFAIARIFDRQIKEQQEQKAGSRPEGGK